LRNNHHKVTNQLSKRRSSKDPSLRTKATKAQSLHLKCLSKEPLSELESGPACTPGSFGFPTYPSCIPRTTHTNHWANNCLSQPNTHCIVHLPCTALGIAPAVRLCHCRNTTVGRRQQGGNLHGFGNHWNWSSTRVCCSNFRTRTPQAKLPSPTHTAPA
jgi:hypothetical protein